MLQPTKRKAILRQDNRCFVCLQVGHGSPASQPVSSVDEVKSKCIMDAKIQQLPHLERNVTFFNKLQLHMPTRKYRML